MTTDAVAVRNKNVTAGTGEKMSFGERFRIYLLNNSEYFAMAGCLMSGNISSYCAGKIAEAHMKGQN